MVTESYYISQDFFMIGSQGDSCRHYHGNFDSLKVAKKLVLQAGQRFQPDWSRIWELPVISFKDRVFFCVLNSKVLEECLRFLNLYNIENHRINHMPIILILINLWGGRGKKGVDTITSFHSEKTNKKKLSHIPSFPSITQVRRSASLTKGEWSSSSWLSTTLTLDDL